MRKIITSLIILILGCSNIYSNSAFDPVLAQIKLESTKLIKQAEVDKAIKLLETQYKRELTAEEKDIVLNQLIDNELVLQAAKRDGMQITEKQILENFKQKNPGVSDEQIKKTAEQQYNQDWDKISKALIDTYTVQQYIQYKGAEDMKEAAPIPTEEEVLKFYNENSDSFKNPDMVRVDHVFFVPDAKTPEADEAAKKRAEDAMLLYKQGKKTFEELVQEVSEDRNSARNGGELGFITRSQPNHIQLLGKSFIDQVFTLAMDEVHGVVKSASGYHIIVVKEKRSKRFLKITDRMDPSNPMTVAQYIQQNIYQERANKAIATVSQKIVDEIRKEAVIKIMDKALPWK